MALPTEATLEHDNWKRWFGDHGPRLLLCARLWTRSRADAEDVVQEAFVRYWRNQRHLGGDPFPLLLTSIRRASIDLARSRDRRAAREEQAAVESPENERLFEPDERSVAMEFAVGELPAPQREVLVLKIWGELTFAEIADQLSIPPDTAASRYRYALASVRKILAAKPQ